MCFKIYFSFCSQLLIVFFSCFSTIIIWYDNTTIPYNISQYAPLCIWNYFLSFALYFHKVFHFFFAHCRQLFNGNSLLHWLCSFFRFIIKPFAEVFFFFLLLCCIQHIYYIYSALFLFLCAGFLFYWANPFAIPNSLICLGAASLPPSSVATPSKWDLGRSFRTTWRCKLRQLNYVRNLLSWSRSHKWHRTASQGMQQGSRAARGRSAKGKGGSCSEWGWPGGFRSVVGRARKLKGIAIENTQRVKWLKRFVGRGRGRCAAVGVASGQ